MNDEEFYKTLFWALIIILNIANIVRWCVT